MLDVFVLLLCSVGIACAANNSRPSDVVILKGKRVELPCDVTKSSNEFHWTFTSVGATEVTIYSTGIGVNEHHASRMAVNKTSDHSYNLIIDSAQLHDAGLYVCKVISTNGASSVTKKTEQLIVLDHEPDCGTNLSSLYNSVTEGDFFQMCCNISFRGNLESKMECSKDGDNGNRLSEESSFTISVTSLGLQSVMHTVTYFADRSKHKTSYSCRFFFSRDSSQNVDVRFNSISFYGETWVSPRVNITYAPKELSITPDKQIYNPGDRLTCFSDANPTPSLKWQELNMGRSISGNTFPIKEYMTQEPISNLECTASNSLGSTSRKISFSVEKAPSQSSSSSFTSITLTVGGILFLFLVAILAMLIIYHIHIKRIVAGRKKESNENNVNPLPPTENYEEIQEDEGRVQSNHDDDVTVTYTMMSDTTYDELTPRGFIPRATYSDLAIDRPPSQPPVFAQRNSISEETEEPDRGQNQRKHNYMNARKVRQAVE